MLESIPTRKFEAFGVSGRFSPRVSGSNVKMMNPVVITMIIGGIIEILAS